MSNLNLGIIGAGQIAERHLEVIKAIKGIEVKAVTSRTVYKAKKLSQKFKIKKTYRNTEDLLKNENLDGLLILVSPDQIFSTIKKIVSYKIPFFTEKPPGLSYEDCKKLSILVNKNNIPNMVGFNRRFYSIFHKGLKIIKKHGRLFGISIEGHERFWKISKALDIKLRKSWIYANSTHTIDLLLFFGGSYSSFKSHKLAYIEKKGDQFSSIIKFTNGTIGNYQSYWYSPGGWSVKLFGEGCTVEFNPLEKGHWIDKNLKKHKIIPSKYDLKYKPGFYEQMQMFKKLLITKKNIWPSQDIKSSLQTMKVAKNLLK